MIPQGEQPRFSSKGWRKTVLHTVSLVEEWLVGGDSVIDIGCGTGYVLWQLAERNRLGRTLGIDIVDDRRVQTCEFQLYDGIHIPAPDKSFDVGLLNFVLHHVPNDRKPLLLAEAKRACRRRLLVLEDTPINLIDWYISRRHGERHRRQIKSNAPYGFFPKEVWEQKFREQGFSVLTSRRISRFARNWRHPFARSMFLLGTS